MRNGGTYPGLVATRYRDSLTGVNTCGYGCTDQHTGYYSDRGSRYHDTSGYEYCNGSETGSDE